MEDVAPSSARKQQQQHKPTVEEEDGDGEGQGYAAAEPMQEDGEGSAREEEPDEEPDEEDVPKVRIVRHSVLAFPRPRRGKRRHLRL